MGAHFPMPIGRFIAANLTPAGQLTRWSDGEIFRAIRNSVDADGHWLMVMSLTNVGKLRGIVTLLPACGRAQGWLAKVMRKISYDGYRFPPEIIQRRSGCIFGSRSAFAM